MLLGALFEELVVTPVVGRSSPPIHCREDGVSFDKGLVVVAGAGSMAGSFGVEAIGDVVSAMAFERSEWYSPNGLFEVIEIPSKGPKPANS